MLRALGTALLALSLAACGSNTADEASSPASTSTPSGEDGTTTIADLEVATSGDLPCAEAKQTSLDEAIASGGVWMPNAEQARMDDLEQAWTCSRDLPALEWPGLTIMFLPDAPARPRAFFEEAAGKVGGRVDSVLGVPAFVLEAQDEAPAEVELVMGDTHIVLVGTNPEASPDQLLEVAASMAPLH